MVGCFIASGASNLSDHVGDGYCATKLPHHRALLNHRLGFFYYLRCLMFGWKVIFLC
jgi:hypothetical protein